SSKYAGRITGLLVDESDRAERGDVLVEISDNRTAARVDRAEGLVRAESSRLEGLRVELERLERVAPLAVREAESALQRRRAELAEAREVREQRRRDAERFRKLFNRSTVARKTMEDAQLALERAESAVDAAQAAVRRAESSLGQARQVHKRVEAKRRRIESAEASLARAKAELGEMRGVRQDLAIRSPVNGTVVAKMAEAGEYVQPGSPILELVDLDRLYLKVFISQKDFGRVALGQQARIHVDAWPDKAFPAMVGEIASQAEFTPKEVQTKDERTRLVFWARLYLDENPGRALTPGLPADAVIRIREDAPWREPMF
ncbi:MAG: HlyD family secretion protein, partial [Desulfovibrionaceae bacterium]